MKQSPLALIAWLLVGTMALFPTSGCVHDPIIPPVDSTQVVDDTTGIDTSDTTGNQVDTTSQPPPDSTEVTPCDPQTVYFQQEVLPILISNCTQSGCHDVVTASDGVVLMDYASVMATADVRAGNPDGSDLYEVLVEDDPDKRMPQPPNPALSAQEISLIRNWIQQGAQDLSCTGDTAAACHTANLSYQADIVPILQTYCIGCHEGDQPSGGVSLDTHSGTAEVASNGFLVSAVKQDGIARPMPLGQSKIPACSIAQIEAWVNDGFPNN